MKKSIVYLIGGVACSFLAPFMNKPEALLAACLILYFMAVAHAVNKE